MRGYELSMLEPEFALPEWDIDLETDPTAERGKRLRRQRSLRMQALARIFGLIMGGPLPMPALPQQRPAIVATDPQRRGGQGGRESEAELMAVRAHHPEARLMERLGRLATRTEDDAEAEALIGALLPLAARVVPRAAPALVCAASRLVPGLSGAARVLREHRATRPLVRRLPTVARRTALVLGRRAALARPTTPEVAVRTLAHQAMRVLDQDGPGRAARLLESGSAPVPAPRIIVSPRYPATSVDRRTAGTGGIETMTFDVSNRNEQVVTIYGKILPQTGRRGFEKRLRSPGDVPALRGRDYDRAHLWGRQFGDEAGAGVMYAPKNLNTGKQRVLEGTLKGMRRNLRSGESLVLRARATSYPGHPGTQPIPWSTLRRIEYDFSIVDRNRNVVDSKRLQFDIGPPTHPTVSYSG